MDTDTMDFDSHGIADFKGRDVDWDGTPDYVLSEDMAEFGNEMDWMKFFGI